MKDELEVAEKFQKGGIKMFNGLIPEISQLIIVAEESFLEWLKRGETPNPLTLLRRKYE